MISALICLMLAIPVDGNEPEPNRIRAVRVEEAPAIDGHLNDLAWHVSAPSSAFTQKFPDEGKDPTERTIVRVLYDDDAVYVGIDCEQQTTPMRKRLTRRDREAESEGSSNRINPGSTDRVTIHIGSRRDGSTAYQFGVNAAGVLSDGIHFDDTRFTARWDENWEGRSAMTENGWSAELRIPLRALRFDEEAIQDWGFNVRRYIAARQEVDEWAFTPRNEPGVVSRFGRLENLEDLNPKSQYELRPFVVGEIGHRTDAPVTTEAYTSRWSAGIDGKWQPTTNLTVSATLNPDFGQVEADQVVLNLTTFEVFLPEKRPFFLEGLELFETPKEILYTRRIGIAPGTPKLAVGETLISTPRPSSIIGALKITGQPMRNVSLGLVSAIVDKNLATVINGNAARPTPMTRVASPLMLANALRIKVDTGKNSHLGFLGTGALRFEQENDYPVVQDAMGNPGGIRCASGAILTGGIDCERDAYVGGLDGRWRNENRHYFLTWQTLGSKMVGGQPQTLRDGTTLSPGDTDTSTILRGGKDGGTFQLESAFNYTGKRFDYNDLGYSRQQNNIWGYLELGARTTQPWKFVKESRASLWAKELTNVDGFAMTRDFGADGSIMLPSLWRFSAEFRVSPHRYDQREIGGSGAIFELEPGKRYELSASSPQSQPLIASFSADHLDTGPGGLTEMGGQLFLRAFPQVELDLFYSHTLSEGERRYLSRSQISGRTQYLFGRLRARGDSTTLRATYSISPTLTFQAYTQLFRAFRRYTDFATSSSGQNAPVILRSDLFASADPGTSPNHLDLALNATIVLRWEYSLGSTVFLVYSRANAPELNLEPGERPRLTFNVDTLTSGQATQAILIKLAHWWG
ncbi:MAG: DUF5916 domain-containing protein [Deltaproteobacteria bacterium]|nr:DUF5916 domain-containing protein [Deltaproteobacteria bacterium]